VTDRQPLIFLPGLLCDARLYDHQTRYLSDVADCRVADLTRHDTIADMATAVLDDAPARFSLAALSMGGYVALEIMRQAPERVERLALLDTSARPDTVEQQRRRKGLLSLSESGRFKGVTPKLLPLLVHQDRLGDEPLVNDIMAMAEAIGRDAFKRQQTAILNRRDSRDTLGAIACPAMVVCGRQDAITPPELAEEMAGLLPRGRLVMIEDCGHLCTMERPQAATALLRDWLLNR
jgi:pimeloyl-ACP methyl ester carboxylesterase